MHEAWPFTARGAGVLVLGAGCLVAAAYLGSVQVLAVAVVLLALPVVAALALRISRPDVTVARSVEPIVHAGSRTDVTVHVRVHTALPTTPGTWRDTVPTGFDGRTDGAFPALGSGWRGADGRVDLRYELVARRRGVHTLGPLQLTLIDPFGVARRARIEGAVTRVVVSPQVQDLPPLSEFAGADDGVLQATTSRRGQGADDLVARPYQPGDSMRRVHWRATAHRGQLMVREEEREATPTATVLVDRDPAVWDRTAREAGGDPAFERAVSLCVSAVTALVRDGYSVQTADATGMPLAPVVVAGDLAAARTLTTRFATVTVDTAPASPGRAAPVVRHTGPLLLLTGHLQEAGLARFTPWMRAGTRPMLLATDPDAGVLDAARATGWQAASLDDRDLAEAWADVAAAGAGQR